MSVFGHLELAPPDPILGTVLAYKADPHPKKVNLGVGAYRDEQGEPQVFSIVRKVEQEIAADPSSDKEYAPIDGYASLKEPAQVLAFGKADPRIATCQALSGTGALRVLGEFAATHLSRPKIYVSKPTWGNHLTIFKNSGLEVVQYPYWDNDKRAIDMEGMLGTISSAPKGSLVLLHAVAHNPTGMDPTPDQWGAIKDLIVERGLIPVLDNAYQGYASGSLEDDVFSQRLFYESGVEMFLCQSFAKNMGLYGERIGFLHIVTSSAEHAQKVMSQLKLVVRPMYSSPPIHGSKLVLRILKSPENMEAWKTELAAVSGRIGSVRRQLADGLAAKGTPGTWSHIAQQIGMFSFTGLTPAQCERMIDTHHIYMLKNGRISMAGLNQGNLQYVIDAIDDCVRNA